jgi:hypothetical protein
MVQAQMSPIHLTGDNVNIVMIHVGATGDDAVSKQLADRIKNRLSWL